MINVSTSYDTEWISWVATRILCSEAHGYLQPDESMIVFWRKQPSPYATTFTDIQSKCKVALGQCFLFIAGACNPTEVANSDHVETGSITGTTGQTVDIVCDYAYYGSGTVTCGEDGNFDVISCQGQVFHHNIIDGFMLASVFQYITGTLSLHRSLLTSYSCWI